MYPPVVNSPKTELTELITDTQTEITVANASVLLPGEGIAVLGNGDVAETITYTSVEENVLKGCVRGFEGVARAWPVGTRIARNFTAADWRAATQNIESLKTKFDSHGNDHISSGSDPIPNATESESGLMSAADKVTLTETKESLLNFDTKDGVNKKNRTELMYNHALNEANVIPADSLKRSVIAINKSLVLRVAIIGDSITENGGLGNTDDLYVSRLIRELKNKLPQVNVIAQNFALGGRWLALFNDGNYKGIATEGVVADGFKRSWSVVGKSWKDHVKDFNADLVILAFGMNDSYGTDASKDSKFASELGMALTTINSWASKPSVSLVSTILPTNNIDISSQRQDIIISVVRSTRAFARNNKLSLADASRLYQILRDGKDDLTRVSKSEKNWANYPNGWSGETSGYTISGTTITPTSGGVIQRERTFYNGSIVFSVRPPVAGDPGVTAVNYRVSDLGKFTVFVAGGSGDAYVRLYRHEEDEGFTQLQESSGLTIPVNNWTDIKIVAEEDNHQVFVAGVKRIDQTTYSNLHDGKISMRTATSSSAVMSDLNINFRDPISGSPFYSEEDLLGKHVPPYDEGSGVNHPSSLGHALTYFSSFVGIVSELSKIKETGMATAVRIASTEFGNPDGSYPAPSGRQLWYKFMPAPAYRKDRGIKLIRRDNGFTYNLSRTAISQATSNLLGNDEFAYFSVGTVDILLLQTEIGTPLNWDVDLFRYQD
ncbi:SGNH/GDSL hydrolase family protein [Paenibacillus peoriae]|nr:SGNH/GDSL hydrolase family protein [Paenibacillus peoriae]